MKTFSLTLVLLFGPFLVAQQTSPCSQPLPSPSAHTIITTTTMKDASAVDLTPSDLEIKEDGKPVTITNIRKQTRAPLHYCVLFDVSGSEEKDFRFQKSEALALLARVIKPGIDHGWALIFNTELRESDETTDPQAIANLVSEAVAKGGTSLYDAMASCASRMAKGQAEKERQLRTIFLFTNGEDNASLTDHEQAIQGALKAGLRIYAFAPESGLEHHAKWVLTMFTKPSGGRLFRAQKTEGVERAIEKISRDLNDRVEVTYLANGSATNPGPYKFEVKARKSGILILAPEKTASPNVE